MKQPCAYFDIKYGKLLHFSWKNIIFATAFPMSSLRLYDGQTQTVCLRAKETYRTETKNKLKPMSSHD